MGIKNYILALLLPMTIGISYSVIAQDKQLANAGDNFNNYAFIDAQQIYLKVANRGYKSSDLYKKLGDSYYFNAELDKSVEWYGKLYKEYFSIMEAEYLFRYAQSLKSVGQYEQADKIMERFDKLVGNQERRAKLFGNERDYLKFIEKQSGKYTIRKLDINSSFSDFAPSFNKDELVFASSRSNTMAKVVHEWNEMPFLDLFTVGGVGNGNGTDLVDLQKLKGKVNTKFHESSSSFSADGNTVYFTRNNYTNSNLKQNKKGTTLLKLYRSKLVNGKWSKAEELPFNNDAYSVAHPALSSDGKFLYFASDMPGGQGQSDLYRVTVNENGSFGKPQSLGNQINTEGRETFPYISQSGRLYFASDGHVGLGGLDIFLTMPSGNSFKKPLNIGEPVNSQHDDFTFILNEETRIGYFASNRSGGMGSDDIYSFWQKEDLITKYQQFVKGVVTDAKNRTVLNLVEVRLLDKNNKELESRIVGKDGKYQFDVECESEYIIRASHPDYKSTEIHLITSAEFGKVIAQPLQLNKGQELRKISVIVGDDLAKILQLEPIYFDYNKSFIRNDAEIELQKVIAVMQQYPEMKIDVRSHTDSRANDAYNMRLSDRRAQSTIKYIITKGGIAKGRLTGRGYGESTLVNECVNNVDCSEEKHQLNRRSEFIILQ